MQYVAASCLDDHMDRSSRRELELLDGRRHHADDPRQAAGADDGLGIGAMGDDPLDDAGDLVAGREAADRLAGEQDVVRADLDQEPAYPRNGPGTGRSARDHRRASSGSLACSGEWPTMRRGEDVANAFPGDRSERLRFEPR